MADITPYDDNAHRPQVLALFSDVPFKGAIWEYQFLNNPGATLHGFQPVVAEDGGRVVGFNGVVPVSIVWNGKPIEALWSCDFKVSAELRGQGVGRLIKEDLAKKSPVLMAFGISPVASMVLQRMGWHANQDVHFLKKIRRPRSLRDVALTVFQFLSAALNWSYGGGRLTTLRKERLPGNGEIDDLWIKVQAGYNKVVMRNGAYMDWRYQQNPFGTYRFIEVRGENGQLEAIGVVRASGGQVRLVDYVGPASNLAVKRALVKAMLEYWQGAIAFSAMTSDSELKRVMKSLGFYQGREQPRFYVWASNTVFEPTVCERSAQGWFVMGGDSDGDLLQAARESWNEKNTHRENM